MKSYIEREPKDAEVKNEGEKKEKYVSPFLKMSTKEEGNTALHIAAGLEEGALPLVQYFLKKGASSKARNNFQLMPIAMTKKGSEVFEKLDRVMGKANMKKRNALEK